MTRAWRIWTAFGICLAIVFASVVWITISVLRLESAHGDAQRQAELEEKMRLALWRLDSFLTPLIIEESARPATHYASFHGSSAFTRSYQAIDELLIPSPLLTFTSSNLLLHFEYDASGRLTSPQVPAGRELAAALSNQVTAASIDRASAALEKLRTLLQAPSGDVRKERVSNGQVLLDQSTQPAAQVPSFQQLNESIAVQEQAQRRQLAEPLANASPAQVRGNNSVMQTLRNSAEWNARNFYQQQVGQADGPALNAQAASDERRMKPVWIENELLLVRQVVADGRAAMQGAWMNWPHLHQALVATVNDLFPGADIHPVAIGAAKTGVHQLAAIPARLVVSAAAARSDVVTFWTPARWSLVVVWTAMFLAAVAVGMLLFGAVSLSERRGAFVSAVTHELRTPLTTFKMYSEMLAEGMVPDEAQRAHYLQTLCAEANRLGHLVENVLAYARLERGSARSRVERFTLRELIERVAGRLRDRAGQAAMHLSIDVPDQALDATVHVDGTAVEQILFNLVDNACKYAGPAEEKVIHLEAAIGPGRFAMLRVRDHGQGISAEQARKLFTPFSKSAQEAAQSAPGIGLGLALCRRLSRSIGGDLRLINAPRGACFELRLPLSGHAGAVLNSI